MELGVFKGREVLEHTDSFQPRSPHLNGMVERVQRTDREEFYAQTDVKSPQLPHHLTQWQEFYNKSREHGSLCYKTPWQWWEELQAITPSHEEIRQRYDPSKERLRVQDYSLDKRVLLEQGGL